jgi:hypothetical protein
MCTEGEGEDEPHFIRNKLALSARLTDSSLRKGEGVELFDDLEELMGMDLESSLDTDKKKKGRSKDDKKASSKPDSDSKSSKKRSIVNSDSNSSGTITSSKKKKSSVESPVAVTEDADANANDMTTPSNLTVAHIQPNISPSGTSLKAVTCNCRKSHCLKLYCDCFKIKNYCNGCNCVDCANTIETESTRRKAIDSILDRNPNAFTPRVDPNSDSKEHFLGCHCKKSNCLKKYCECFSGSVCCSDRCRCSDCKNLGGNDDNSNNYEEQQHAGLIAAEA